MIVFAIWLAAFAAGLGLLASGIWNGLVRGRRYESLRKAGRRDLWLGAGLLVLCALPWAIALLMS